MRQLARCVAEVATQRIKNVASDGGRAGWHHDRQPRTKKSIGRSRVHRMSCQDRTPALGMTTLLERKVPTYIASPYGFADSTRSWYYGTFIPLLKRHVEVLDPWAEAPLPLSADASATDRWLELGCRHLDNIKDNAQLLVAGLDQEPPDTGTVVELAWAAAHRIPVIAYRSDLRTSGEDGLKYNLMIGSAIQRSGGIEVSDLASLEEQLAHYAVSLVGK